MMIIQRRSTSKKKVSSCRIPFPLSELSALLGACCECLSEQTDAFCSASGCVKMLASSFLYHFLLSSVESVSVVALRYANNVVTLQLLMRLLHTNP